MTITELSAFFRKTISPNGDADKLSQESQAFLHLDAQMRAMEPWKARSGPHYPAVEETVSGSIWKSIPGGHKWLDYFRIYDREFARFRDKQVRVLEIGVYKGASLKLWKAFFGDGATIVGIDIDEECRAYSDEEHGIFVEIGSQADGDFLQKVIERYGPFDLILDDGSHVASHQIASFNSLFTSGLKNGGAYFVEDLECMYWGHTDEFRDRPVTSIDFFKSLIDIQNSIFSDYEYNDFAIHVGTLPDEYVAINLAKSIESIKFYRGVVLIEKNEQHPPITLHL